MFDRLNTLIRSLRLRSTLRRIQRDVIAGEFEDFTPYLYDFTVYGEVQWEGESEIIEVTLPLMKKTEDPKQYIVDWEPSRDCKIYSVWLIEPTSTEPRFLCRPPLTMEYWTILKGDRFSAEISLELFLD